MVDCCPYCGGRGMEEHIAPTCCGNVNKIGECKSYCAVPELIEVPCTYCGGSGWIEIPEDCI